MAKLRNACPAGTPRCPKTRLVAILKLNCGRRSIRLSSCRLRTRSMLDK